MADTRPDIVVPKGAPLDVYAALNAQAGFPAVTVGDQLLVVNKGSLPVYLWAKATAPTNLVGGLPIVYNQQASNNLNDSGAFVSSPVKDGLITVQVLEAV
ncbi:hypothetical protein [Pseudoalteromonas phage XCL1123]|nr:hypothetical protein [Pseudoalteromonas phage XCL1123]